MAVECGIVTRACRGRHGGVAQLARACGSYPQCHRFKSSRRYHTGEMRQHLSGVPSKDGPLVKRLRHGPFTAVTWVRFPYGSPCRHPKGRRQFGGLAQLVRAPASHAGGHWFESSSLHQIPPHLRWDFSFCLSKSRTDLVGRVLLGVLCGTICAVPAAAYILRPRPT